MLWTYMERLDSKFHSHEQKSLPSKVPLSKLIRSDRRRSRSSSHNKSMGRSMAASRKCLHNDLVLNPPPQKRELQNGKLINEREAS